MPVLGVAVMLFRGDMSREAHLRAVLTEYGVRYNTAGPHQGIAPRVLDGEHDGGHLTVADLDRGRIHRTPFWAA